MNGSPLFILDHGAVTPHSMPVRTPLLFEKSTAERWQTQFDGTHDENEGDCHSAGCGDGFRGIGCSRRSAHGPAIQEHADSSMSAMRLMPHGRYILLSLLS